MAVVKISELPVGSVVTAKIDGQRKKFIIYCHSKPSNDYDDSCDGTWLFTKDSYIIEEFGDSQLYAPSYITNYLNTTFYGALENGIKSVIKPVKIPYSSDKNTVKTGADGYSCNIFLFSATEVGFSGSNINVEGTPGDYFGTNESRIALYNNEPYNWVTRSFDNTQDNNNILYINENGELSSGLPTSKYGIRPVFVIYSSCLVDQDTGTLIPNIAPIITSSVNNGADLGTKNDIFTFSYTVTTSRPDLNLEIEEELSGTNYLKTKKIISDPVSGSERDFSIVINDSSMFYKLMNGEKRIVIRARYSNYSDASVESESEFYVTFNKNVSGAIITLKTPMTVSGNITKGFLKVDGSIPDDASFKIEVTNNGNNSSPTWTNVTTNVKSESDFSFTSIGNSFNFKVTINRGSSKTSGYIASIAGAFE